MAQVGLTTHSNSRLRLLDEEEELEGTEETHGEEIQSNITQLTVNDNHNGNEENEAREISSPPPLSLPSKPSNIEDKIKNPREKKCWGVVKTIPVVNVLYGGVRSTVYAIQGDKEESLRSLGRAVGGVCEIGSFIGVTAAVAASSVVAGPAIIIGTTVVALTASSAAGNVVGGGSELILDAVCDENFEGADKEEKVYDRIVKDTVIIGAAYSATRACVYKIKGNKEKAKESIKNAGVNALSSSLGILAGVGLAKIATSASAPIQVVNQSWKSRVWSVISNPLRSVNSKIIPPAPVSTLEVVTEKAVSAVTSSTGRGVVASSSQHFVKIVAVTLDDFLNSDDVAKLPVLVGRFQESLDSLTESTKSGAKAGAIEVKRKVDYIVKCLIKGFLLIMNEIDELEELITSLDPRLKQIIEMSIPVLLQVIVVFAPGSPFTAVSRFYGTNRGLFIAANSLARYFFNATDLKNGNYNSESAKEIEEKLVKEQDNQKYVLIPSYIISHSPKSPCTMGEELTVLNRGKRVLCIDGGGIRGLVPVEILQTLQTIMQQEHGGQEIKITECFDYVCGTSTGGLIALLLGLNKSLKEIQGLYFEMKDKVFSGWKKPYCSENFEQLLKEFFGETTKMHEIQGIRVIITACYGNVDHLQSKIFTNYGPGKDELIWKVARRTCSAPGYFNPMDEEEGSEIPKFYDGGLTCNNPTNIALREIQDEIQNGVILSIGTGKMPERNKHLPNVKHTVAGKLKMIISGELEQLIEAFVRQMTKTDGDIILQDVFLARLAGCHYFRATPDLPEDVKLDETDNDKIVNMIFHSKAYAALNQNTLRNISKLVSPHYNK